MKSLISIIVPVYKVERYLARCIDSVLAQTYTNFELILVDDGSPDSCPQICDEYAKKDKRIKVIHKKNEGVSVARNTGIDNAKGEFIAFLDSDDYLEPNYLQVLINKQEETNADMVFCRYNSIIGDRIQKENVDIDTFTNNKEWSRLFTFSNNVMGCIWRTLYKKTYIGETRFCNNLKFCEDLYFILCLLKKDGKFVGVNDCLYNYFINSNSCTQKYTCNTTRNYSNAILKCTEIIPNLPNVENAELLVCNCLFNIYVSACHQKMKINDKNCIKEFDKYNNKENYKAVKLLNKEFKFRSIFFLFRHKMFFLYKVLLKTKNLFKK